MDELQQRIDAIKQKMQQLDTTTKQGQKEFKKLEKELVSYNSAVTQNVTNTERIRNAINNLSGTSLKELRRALVAAKSELGKTFENDPNLKKTCVCCKVLHCRTPCTTLLINRARQLINLRLQGFYVLLALF